MMLKLGEEVVGRWLVWIMKEWVSCGVLENLGMRDEDEGMREGVGKGDLVCEEKDCDR